MSETRRHDVAAHEAAHIVVGCALGLRLRRASVGMQRRGDGAWLAGYAWFAGRARGHREAWALMHAAGVAWDRSRRTPGMSHSIDATEARRLCSGRAGYLVMLRAAAALLASLQPEHEAVTRALLERDLTSDDIAAIARGEELLD